MNDSIKKEMLLNQLGSTWTLDGLFLFINAPTAIVSFTLNFLSLIVFRKLKLSDGIAEFLDEVYQDNSLEDTVKYMKNYLVFNLLNKYNTNHTYLYITTMQIR